MNFNVKVPYEHRQLFDMAVTHFLAVTPKLIQSLRSAPGKKKNFTYTDQTDAFVGNVLFKNLQSSEEIEIRTYKSKWPWSKAVAYTDLSDGKNIIYFNSRRINDYSYKDIAGTIAHEFCHEPCGYGHGSNTPNALKMMSVPYALGGLVSGRSPFPLNRYY